jgi:hypothetical protein
MKKIMLTAAAFLFAVAMFAQTGTTTAPAAAPKQTTPAPAKPAATAAPASKPAETKGESKPAAKGAHKGKGHHKKAATPQ